MIVSDNDDLQRYTNDYSWQTIVLLEPLQAVFYIKRAWYCWSRSKLSFT